MEVAARSRDDERESSSVRTCEVINTPSVVAHTYCYSPRCSHTNLNTTHAFHSRAHIDLRSSVSTRSRLLFFFSRTTNRTQHADDDMSNLKPFYHHVQAQAHSFKHQATAWWHERTSSEKLRDIFLSPGAFSLVLIVIATYCNAFMSVYVDQTNPPLFSPLPDRLCTWQLRLLAICLSRRMLTMLCVSHSIRQCPALLEFTHDT